MFVFKLPTMSVISYIIFSPVPLPFRTENFGERNLKYHIQIMGELIERDKNRPSVIAWSVANEPKSDTDYSENYFRCDF